MCYYLHTMIEYDDTLSEEIKLESQQVSFAKKKLLPRVC